MRLQIVLILQPTYPIYVNSNGIGYFKNLNNSNSEKSNDISNENNADNADVSARKYPCTICNKKLSRRYALHLHLRKVHGKDVINRYRARKECEICKEKFGFNRIETHSEKCQKYFKYMKKLENEIKCQFCSYKKAIYFKVS